MEVQLQDLVEKIKRDGIASAEQQAAGIIAEAEKKAKAIVADAEKEAETLLKKTEVESQRFTNASEAAVKQACRNALIAFREGVVDSLNALIKTETAAAYNSDVLKTLIPEAGKGLKQTKPIFPLFFLPKMRKSWKALCLLRLRKRLKKASRLNPMRSLQAALESGSRTVRHITTFLLKRSPTCFPPISAHALRVFSRMR